MSNALLSCQDLRVERAAGFVLRIPSLELETGTVTAVTGPNGSGKSTLLLACAGLLDLAAGRVTLEGEPFHEGLAPAPALLRQRAVLVPQTPYLFRGSVLRNLCWGMRLRRLPGSEQETRAEAVLATLGIEALAGHDARRLSGGQQTLVAVARALVLRPALLLLDEVTRDLDQVHRPAVVRAIRAHVADHGGTVLLATHDRNAVELLADRQIHLENGWLIRKDRT